MKYCILLLTLLFTSYASIAQQGVLGKWKTIDDETGEARSIIEIYKKGNLYYGKIHKILSDDPGAQNCSKCAEEYRNKSMVGVIIMKALKKDGNEYEDGTIVDPENGKTYRCKIWVDEEDPTRLNVRGYIAFLYRTQQWIKV